MKKVLFSVLCLAAAQSAFAADVLNCWRTDFHPKTPFMTATINSAGVLSNITFNYRTTGLQNASGAIRGQLITSNHSPYNGNLQYAIAGSGYLILPADLSNANLEAIEAKGIGYYKNENGVLISSVDSPDNDGGSHVSYRLSCRSTK